MVSDGSSEAASALRGKTVLITGASAGIGRATAVALAERGARLILAGRAEERHREVLVEVRSIGAAVEFVPLDLGKLSSVRACAESVSARGEPLHCLINNAGVGAVQGQTEDGFELTFGINHLGHFLLTELLLPKLEASAPSRIVTVASAAHYQARSIDWAALQRPTTTRSGLREYAVSKLCNVLHARHLAERLRGRSVSTYAVHPGTIATKMVLEYFPRFLRPALGLVLLRPEQGATTSVHCAASAAAGAETGLYFHRARPRKPSALARDPELARELYDRSRAWVDLEGGG